MSLVGRIKGAVHEAAKRGSKIAQAIGGEPPRSPHWPTIEKRWKKAHPQCAACGSTSSVQVHHVRSFATHPELELQDGTGIAPATGGKGAEPNFISLCEASGDHHLALGHGGSFAKGGYNPQVVEHAFQLLHNPSQQANIFASARAARVSPPEAKR